MFDLGELESCRDEVEHGRTGQASHCQTCSQKNDEM